MKEYYLDNAATTCVAKPVRDRIFEVMDNVWGNPSSTHAIGNKARDVVNQARKTIADYINCKPSEIIFTSGACEANSLAILGWLRAHHYDDVAFLQSPIEHKSINSLIHSHEFNHHGHDAFDVDYINVDDKGCVDLDDLEYKCNEAQVKKFTPFVSIQASNSELGTIQYIKKISEVVHTYNGIFHCDATQLFPYQRIDVKKLGIDMMSMSGQKINAPKGIGFLYVKEGIELAPLIYGSQENGQRGGTENVPYIAGLAKAIELLNHDWSSLKNIRDYMELRLICEIGHCIVNGCTYNRLPNNINISFKGIESESLMLLLNMNGIYVSSGSACNSGDNSPSHVLQAIKVPDEYIRGTIRISLPDDFTIEDADYVVDRIKECVERLRKFGER